MFRFRPTSPEWVDCSNKFPQVILAVARMAPRYGLVSGPPRGPRGIFLLAHELSRLNGDTTDAAGRPRSKEVRSDISMFVVSEIFFLALLFVWSVTGAQVVDKWIERGCREERIKVWSNTPMLEGSANKKSLECEFWHPFVFRGPIVKVAPKRH